MKLSSIECNDLGVLALFENGKRSLYPYIWLRDNDPAGFHPDTRERTFDLTSVALDVQPLHHACTRDALSLSWPDSDRVSVFDAAWLYRHRPGVRRSDPSRVLQRTWSAETLDNLPRFSAQACRSDPHELAEMLTELKRLGIVVVEQLDDDPAAGELFGDLIGFKRETNYGVMFEVINKPDPINLAYTALALPLHTDLANQEFVPGVQFLHCVANTATGGDSVFADGFQICHDLAHEEPDVFETLKATSVPWRFFDDTCDIISHWPVIQQADDGQFEALTFNAHLADIPDLESEQMIRFYAAYQNIMRRIRSDKYRVEYRFKPGEMIIMANRRVLHGRTEFDPMSGFRHLRGYYIEMNEINSRLRVIERERLAVKTT
ncbi:MAG: TauD/TfdA family dioxygenase [Gammaproteobacteria bacterium]